MADGSTGGGHAAEEQVRLLVEHRLRTALHEVRQPLAAVLALAEAAGSVPDVPAAVRRYLEQIVEQVGEVSATVASVLWSLEEDPPAAQPADLAEVLGSAVRSLPASPGPALTRRGHEGPLPTPLPRPLLRRCLVNVLDNAVRAAGPEGSVVLTVQRGARSVRVVVEDDGPGFGRIPPGAGIGLAMTRSALATVGGGLSVGSSSSGGARVVLRLPLLTAGSGLAGGHVAAG